MANNLDKHVCIDKTKEMVESLLNFQDKFEHFGKLTEDDIKIINFMVENSFITAEDSIELSGSLYTLLKVYEELGKEKIESEYLKMFIMIATYVQLYELILLQLDRRLRNYIKLNKHVNQKDFKKFLKNRREYLEHATTGQINEVLSKLGAIESENDSILDGRLRDLRNKFSHANFFYDDELDAVFAGKVKLTKKEFIGEFYRLFNFILTWFKLSANANKPEEAFDSFLRSLKSTFYELSKMFKSVERSGYKKWLGSLVVQWEKEAEKKAENQILFHSTLTTHIYSRANVVNMDAELLRRVERLEEKLDRILEILEDELTEEEIEELNEISERMRRGEKIPLDDLL